MNKSMMDNPGLCQGTEKEPCVTALPKDPRRPGRGSSEQYLDKETILCELQIVPGSVILDAGCGNGYMAKEFCTALNGSGRVYALDRSRDAIDALSMTATGTNIHAAAADITKSTPLPQASVDLIYLSNVFHIFSAEQIRGFNREVKRLLKPGGRLAIVELEKRSMPIGPPVGRRHSPQELERAVGLQPVALADVGPYHYMQIFRI